MSVAVIGRALAEVAAKAVAARRSDVRVMTQA
jgi:hypothetical protein